MHVSSSFVRPNDFLSKVSFLADLLERDGR